MMKKRKNDDDLMGLAKQNMGVGMATMAGMSAVGAMQGMPGVPAGASGPAMAGLGLVSVASLARTGMGVAQMSMPSKQQKRKRR